MVVSQKMAFFLGNLDGESTFRTDAWGESDSLFESASSRRCDDSLVSAAFSLSRLAWFCLRGLGGGLSDGSVDGGVSKMALRDLADRMNGIVGARDGTSKMEFFETPEVGDGVDSVEGDEPSLLASKISSCDGGS